MDRGDELFRAGSYLEAAEEFQKESEADRQDDFKIGAACDVGIALLCAGHRSAAAAQFSKLIQSSLHSVSKHHLYLGLALWEDDRKKSLQAWKAAMECAYSGYRGLDVPYFLACIIAKDSHAWSLEDVQGIIRKRLAWINSDSFIAAIGRYILLIDSEEEFLKSMRETDGMNAEEWRIHQLGLYHFYKGVMEGIAGNQVEFKRRLASCASTHYVQLSFEFVLARMEP